MLIAAIIPSGRAMPLPAISGAVPWSGEVRTNGKPERQIHAVVERDQLERRQPLIVIHRHDRIELPVRGAIKQRVRRMRPADHNAASGGALHRGRDDPPLFVAEQTAFARVRIQSRNRDSGTSDSESAADLVR